MNLRNLLRLRLAFLHSRLFRDVAAGLECARSGRKAFDLAHLVFFREDDACGPIQREEALTLFALVKITRPRLVVEFGFSRGHSALNFLRALDNDGRLHSYDISQQAADFAERYFQDFHNFTFHHKGQTDFLANDLNGEDIDFVLFDASHDLAMNVATFKLIRSHLSRNALIAVHDTGTWRREHMSPALLEWAKARKACDSHGWRKANEYAPWKAERMFVDWLRDNQPEFAQVHLHTHRKLRHGLTILQASSHLERGAD